MPDSSLPSTVSSFLASRGVNSPDADLRRPAALVRAFRAAAPSGPVSSLSAEDMAWAAALLDCLQVMDERLYEHYRAMIDLVRGYFFRAPEEDLFRRAEWDAVRVRAVRMGFLPEDRFGEARPLPHRGVPDILSRVMEGRL